MLYNMCVQEWFTSLFFGIKRIRQNSEQLSIPKVEEENNDLSICTFM